MDINEWKEFTVDSLFNIKRGKTLSSENKFEYEDINGNPCINGSAENNGLLCKLNSDIENENFDLIKSPALSLSRVGNGGMTFYQNKDFYVADNAFSLHLKEHCTKVSVYLFLSTILNKEIFKYSYGRNISLSKYLQTIIKLPIEYETEDIDGKVVLKKDSNGNKIPKIDSTYKYSKEGYIPNFEFMENYINQLPYSDRI